MADNTFALTWDDDGKRQYEVGVDRGVLYTKKTRKDTNQNDVIRWEGVAWNGLISVTESPEGADKTDLWADNIKYASMRAAETFGGTIEAYTYPDEFAACNGEKALDNSGAIVVGQQARQPFGLCYRTKIGNDQDPNAGYKLHLVYNCTCSPSERAYETINDNPDAITFSWEFESDGTSFSGGDKPTTCCLTIDCTKLASGKVTDLEEALYGKGNVVPYLPSPDDVLLLIA